MTRLLISCIITLSAITTTNGLFIPRTQDDIDRMRLAGQAEADIVHSLPIEALSPSFHPTTRLHHTHHGNSQSQIILQFSEDEEAFNVPAYQHPQLLDLNSQVVKSRMLRQYLDRYAFGGVWWQRPAQSRAKFTKVQIPPHGWLRNVMEKITGSGSVEQRDVDELEYAEYVSRLRNPSESRRG